MIYELMLLSIPINLITAYLLLDEQQYRSRSLSKKHFFLLLIIEAIMFGICSVVNYPIIKTICMIMINIFIGFIVFQHRRVMLMRDGFFALCIGACELIIMPIIQFLELTYRVNITNVVWYITCSMLLVQLIVFYMYHLYRKVQVNEKDERTGFAFLNFIFLPIFSFVNIMIITLVSQFYMYPWLMVATILDILFIIFLNIYLSYVYHFMVQSQKLKQEFIFHEQKNELQFAYYQKLEENYQKSRQLIHDVKRHLQMMQTSSQDQQYKEDFQIYLSQYAMPIYSNHRILNMILYEKMMEAEKDNIKFTCETALLDLEFMKDIDVTTIFLNLLDNAIDACKECECDRWIKWKADSIRDFFVIEISNGIKTSPQIEGSTSKQHHEGLGLKNVVQALEIYGGNMQVEFDETTYITHLYIPMK